MNITHVFHGDITAWSDQCLKTCIHRPSILVIFTSTESPEISIEINIPEPYQEYLDAFSKAKASGLSQHYSHYCAIDLLPGKIQPKCWIYPLSQAEQKAMEEYE